MLPLFVLIALAAFSVAQALPWLLAAPPAAFIHLTFAVGAMPLIMGAMTHFIPVLTRSGSPPRSVLAIPVLALIAGLLAFCSFVDPALASSAYYFAALVGLAAACGMAWWSYRRGATALGKPHPCLNWYLAAIGCLILALLAVVAIHFWPEQRPALRRFHLHLNVLGFIGLTAVGTLQVLLPTAAGRADSHASQRMRADLKWMFAGVLITAAGAAWRPPAAWLGALLLAVPVVRLLRVWHGLYFSQIYNWKGAAPSLGAALAGYALMLLFGAMHGVGMLAASNAAPAFILGFLFPLVTGSVSQLLPVWLRPGQQTAWHGNLRQKLTGLGGLRAMLFLSGGTLVALGEKWGLWLGGAALLLFVLPMLKVCAAHGAFLIGRHKANKQANAKS